MRCVTPWGTQGYLRSWVSEEEKEDGASYKEEREKESDA